MVYSQVVTESQGVKLFHEERFKTTAAIGGRKPNDDHPTSISFVWHRMLPIDGNKYLEIVTLFHGGQWDHPAWRRQDKRGEVENQFPVFIDRLKGLRFELTWGNEPKS